MRRLLICAAAASPALVLAITTGDGGGARHPTTLRFDETSALYKVIDNPPANSGGTPEGGDTVLFIGNLMAGGRRIGTKRGSCTVVDWPRAQCMATLSFAGGHLGLVDTFDLDPSRPQQIAFSGGTGIYRGATAQARVTQVSPSLARWVLTVER